MAKLMMSFDPSGANTRFLSRDEVRRAAPSVFAEKPAETTSGRYEYISTYQIFDLLETSGYLPVRAMGKGDKEFGKHMVAFQHRDPLKMRDASGSSNVSRMILYNSHDGKSAYNLMAGAFRFVCENGTVLSDGEYGSAKIKHQGQDALYNVAQGIHEIGQYLPVAFGQLEQWNEIHVDAELTDLYGQAVLMARYGKDGHDLLLPDGRIIEGNHEMIDFDAMKEAVPVRSPVTVEQIVMPRRPMDRNHNDLHTLFQVAQENSTKGGIRGTVVEANGRIKRRATRGVTGIEADRKLNQSLWVLTQAFEQLVRENKAELVF